MTPARRVAVLRYLLDVVCILLFVIIGRRNHGGSTDAEGVLRTGLPFLIALSGAWIGAKAWRAPRSLTTGVILWIVTVVIGLGIRRFSFGDGTAIAFVIVTTITLGLLLVGTRLPRRVRR